MIASVSIGKTLMYGSTDSRVTGLGGSNANIRISVLNIERTII